MSAPSTTHSSRTVATQTVGSQVGRDVTYPIPCPSSSVEGRGRARTSKLSPRDPRLRLGARNVSSTEAQRDSSSSLTYSLLASSPSNPRMKPIRGRGNYWTRCEEAEVSREAKGEPEKHSSPGHWGDADVIFLGEGTQKAKCQRYRVNTLSESSSDTEAEGRQMAAEIRFFSARAVKKT